MKKSDFALALIVAAIVLSGCGARFFSAKTDATYTADGKEITYSSTKEQTGLTVMYKVGPDGKTTDVTIHVDKAGTNESAIAAALQSNAAMADLLKSLIPLIEKAAAAGS